MTSKLRLVLAGASTLLLILALAPPPAQGQALKDHIVQIVYLHSAPFPPLRPRSFSPPPTRPNTSTMSGASSIWRQ